MLLLNTDTTLKMNSIVSVYASNMQTIKYNFIINYIKHYILIFSNKNKLFINMDKDTWLNIKENIEFCCQLRKLKCFMKPVRFQSDL